MERLLGGDDARSLSNIDASLGALAESVACLQAPVRYG